MPRHPNGQHPGQQVDVPLQTDALAPAQIRALFDSYGLVLQEWDKARTDWLTIRESATGAPAAEAAQAAGAE